MSRKQLILIATLILILLGGATALYLYLGNSKAAGPTGSGTVTLPSGSTINTSQTTTSNTTQNNLSGSADGSSVSGQMHQITDEPISGAILVQSGSSTIVRYVERASGHIFQSDALSEPVRLSNTTIPKIYEALWLPDGSGAYFRYLADSGIVKTYFAKLKASTGSSTDAQYELSGNFLPDGISSLSISDTGSRIFYLGATSGGAVGNIANPDGSKKVQVFSSPLGHWQSLWAGNDTLLLTSNASASIPGISFLIPSVGAKSINQKKLLANINGLATSISPDGLYVLYSSNEGGVFKNYTLALKEKNPTPQVFPLRTVPEKCAWSKKESSVIYCAIPQVIPSSTMPDLWYQGLALFADSFWKINISTGATTLVYGPKSSGELYDAINLGLSADEEYLLFTNKRDGSLWILQTKK